VLASPDGPLEQVLEHCGHRAGVFRRADEQRVRGSDGFAHPRDRVGNLRSFSVVVGIEVRQMQDSVEDDGFDVGRREGLDRAKDSGVRRPIAHAA
jgi:hypothetical protein